MADEYDVHRELLGALLSKVKGDQYPSVTMLDMIEGMLRPEEVPAYAKVLMEKVQEDGYPSIDMLRRIRSLT